MVETLGGLQKPGFHKGLARNLAAEAQTQIAEGFRRERDPYGHPWKKSIRARQQSGQTLADRGRMRNAWQGRPERVDEHGFTLANNVKYAMTHQKGATITAKTAKGLRFKVAGRWVRKSSVTIPKRMMVPEGRLGPIWERAFKNAAEAYVRAYVTRQMAGRRP